MLIYYFTVSHNAVRIDGMDINSGTFVAYMNSVTTEAGVEVPSTLQKQNSSSALRQVCTVT
jgi:hypothetical protein